MTTIILSVLYECISFICSHGRQSLELSIYLRNHLAEAQVCYHIRNHQLRVCFFRFSAYFLLLVFLFFFPPSLFNPLLPDTVLLQFGYASSTIQELQRSFEVFQKTLEFGTRTKRQVHTHIKHELHVSYTKN